MKKVFSLIVLLTGVMAFTSCSDDDATYTPIHPLEVTSADLFFEATGGTGSIVVNTEEELTAETTSPWISLAASGNTVTVTAEENASRENRSARIVLTAADGATTNVTATQQGVVFYLNGSNKYEVASGASTLTVSLRSSVPVTVSSLASWITAEYNEEDQEITMAIAANQSNDPRTGQVVIAAAGLEEIITIEQKGSRIRFAPRQ